MHTASTAGQGGADGDISMPMFHLQGLLFAGCVLTAATAAAAAAAAAAAVMCVSPESQSQPEVLLLVLEGEGCGVVTGHKGRTLQGWTANTREGGGG